MQIGAGDRTGALASGALVPAPRQLVMGVHWSPAVRRADAADLDGLCILYDRQHRVMEVIHGGRMRNENESIVHTGDSRDGANHWDDERIFVFVEALPEPVSRLDFVVACADGLSFDEIPGAVCHLTDHATEQEWVRVDLTTLRGRRGCTIATLCRVGSGWFLVAGQTG